MISRGSDGSSARASLNESVREDAAERASAGTGDQRFWALYEDALPHVFGFLVRRCDHSVAEDLTQEVFVTAARAMALGDGAKVTLPWLMTAARSRLIDHYRAEGRRERNLSLAWSVRTDSVAPSAEASSGDRSLSVATERALMALPTRQRVALVLHHVDDLPVAEVADRLGKSVRATESLLARARRRLKAALEVTS